MLGRACGGRARASGSSRSSQSRTRWRSAASSRSRPANRRRAPAQHAGHVIRGQAVLQIGVAVVHSMHLLSRCRPRRIQLFTVPSGASRRAAMSDAPGRRRTPSRWRRAAGRPARPCSRPGGCLPGWPPGGPAGQGVVGEGQRQRVVRRAAPDPGDAGGRCSGCARCGSSRSWAGFGQAGTVRPVARSRENTPAARPRPRPGLNIRLASAYRCGDARRYSSSSADSRWRAHCASKACSGWASVIVSLEQDEAGYSIPRGAPVTLRVTLFPRTTMAAMSGPRIAARPFESQPRRRQAVMDAEFWLERWREGRTHFHQTRVTPLLQKYWPGLDVPAGGRCWCRSAASRWTWCGWRRRATKCWAWSWRRSRWSSSSPRTNSGP